MDLERCLLGVAIMKANLLIPVLLLGGCAAPAVGDGEVDGPLSHPDSAWVAADVRLPNAATAGARGSVRLTEHPTRLYAVVLSADGEDIDVMDRPAGEVIAHLAASATDITGTGAWQRDGDQQWAEIVTPDGQQGWVDGAHLTEVVPADAFCRDSDVADLLDELEHVLTAADGEALFGMVSPRHGLQVSMHDGQMLSLTDRQVADALATNEAMAWGLDPATGEMTVGGFGDLVAARLGEVLKNEHRTACNHLVMEGAGYDARIPAGHENVNFYLIDRPPTTQGDLDWQVWIVGVEQVEGQPYLFSLLRYAWQS